MSHLVKLHLER